MGVATMVLATDTYYLAKQPFMPDAVHSIADAAYDFIFTPGNLPLWVFIVCGSVLFLIGNLVPDMDSQNSILGRIIYIPVKHRTWLHAVYLSCVFLVFGLGTRILFWLGAGVFFHLVWDSPSKMGIDWFYPHRRKRPHHGLYVTGESSEYIFCGIIWGLAVLFSGIIVFLQFHGRMPSLG